MADWFSETILSILHAVPPIFGADAPHFEAARALAALLLITLVVYIISMRPLHRLISCFRRDDRKSGAE
jgi:hypothetical protein